MGVEDFAATALLGLGASMYAWGTGRRLLAVFAVSLTLWVVLLGAAVHVSEGRIMALAAPPTGGEHG